MARKVDITDKLSFEGNPSLVIKGKAIEVNADAPTMLKVMGLMSANDPGAQEILEAYDMMFPEKSKKEIERMKLGFNDLIIVVQEAVQLISGMEEPAGESSDPYYDMFEDWDLIVSSFLSQYGLRIRTKEFETVSWDEFRALIAGLSPETALGRVVAIRSETDKDIIKHYTKDQRRIYDDWRGREIKEMDGKTFEKEMAGLGEDVCGHVRRWLRLRK